MSKVIRVRQGEARHFSMTFRGADGVPTGSAYDAVQMQIRAAGGDVFIDGSAGIFADAQGFAAGWSIPLTAQTLADVPLGEAKVLLWGHAAGAAPDDWTCLSEDYTLQIKWGR